MEFISCLVSFCEVPPCQMQTSKVISFQPNWPCSECGSKGELAAWAPLCSQGREYRALQRRLILGGLNGSQLGQQLVNGNSKNPTCLLQLSYYAKGMVRILKKQREMMRVSKYPSIICCLIFHGARSLRCSSVHGLILLFLTFTRSLWRTSPQEPELCWNPSMVMRLMRWRS